MHRTELALAGRALASLLVGAALLATPAARPALSAERAAPVDDAAPRVASASLNVGLAASGDTDSSSTPLRGKGARRTARFDRLIALFRADRLAVYQQFGFPDYRYYELTFSTRTERWIYLAEDLEFVFAGDRLLRRE